MSQKNSCYGVVWSNHICPLQYKMPATVPAMLVVELSVTLKQNGSPNRLYPDDSRILRGVVKYHCIMFTHI